MAKTDLLTAKNNLSRVLVAALAVALAAILLAIVGSTSEPAQAQADSPSTLTGESFVANNLREDLPDGEVSVDVSCAPTGSGGTSTISYTAQGPSVGPYPGTFTETGTFTLVEVDPPSPIASFQSRMIESFEAEYTVDSPSTGTTVTGSKSAEDVPFGTGIGADLSQEVSTTQGYALCGPFEDNPNLIGQEFANVYGADYEAKIETPSGIYTDEGKTNAGILRVDPRFVVGSYEGRVFQEYFFSGLNEPTPDKRTPATITLDPPAAINPVDTSHTVTATVEDASGQPVEGVAVRFSVEGAVNTTGGCTTDADGQCDFTFDGPQLAGATIIRAFADTDGDGTRDLDEPESEATKSFMLPDSTPGQVTGGGQIANALDSDNIAFGFNAKSANNQSNSTDVKGNCTVVDPSVNTKIKCLDVTNLVQSGTHATFFGKAEIAVGKGKDANTQEVSYRIDVDDLAEPGKGQDTFKVQTDSGYSASGVLKGGNVQIHEP